MKTIPKLASLLAALVILPATQSKAAEVSVDLFYDNLDSYGDWVEVGDYGYCWSPRDVGDDWRPYTAGNWAYTDAGWTWVSDEPYGWAVYHYGRWTRVDRVGWAWVPGTEWGPAWVSWRNSDRYVGWAPLPPESRVSVGVSIGRWADAVFDIGPSNYSFVEVRDLGAPRLRSMIVPPQQNITIINQTRNITNITYKNNVVINNGPDYDVVSRQAAQPIRRLKLQRRAELGDLRTARAEQLGAKVEGESLVVSAPAIQEAKDAKPKKVGNKLDKASIDRGWRNAGDARQIQTARAKLKEEAKDAPANITRVKTDEKATAESTTTKTADSPTAETTESAKPGQPAERNAAGRMKDRKRTAAETDKPVDPASVTAPDQPNVAGQPDERNRGKNKRERDAAARQDAPEAVAEKVKPSDATPPKPDMPAEAKTPPGQRDTTDRPDRTGRADRPQREERQAQPDRADRPNQPERPDRPERPNRAAQPDQPDRPDRPEQRERPNRPERAAQPERPERAAQPDRPDRPNRPEAAAKVERPAVPGGESARPQPKPERGEGRPPGAGKPEGLDGEGKKKGERGPQ